MGEWFVPQIRPKALLILLGRVFGHPLNTYRGKGKLAEFGIWVAVDLKGKIGASA